jgi:hypothetical protein
LFLKITAAGSAASALFPRLLIFFSSFLALQVSERLSDKNITLELTEEALDYVLEHSYNPVYGARYDGHFTPSLLFVAEYDLFNQGYATTIRFFNNCHVMETEESVWQRDLGLLHLMVVDPHLQTGPAVGGEEYCHAAQRAYYFWAAAREQHRYCLGS